MSERPASPEVEGAITVFFKEGQLVGACTRGQEDSWIATNERTGSGATSHDSIKNSTRDRWNAYVRHRADQKNMSPDDAKRNEQEALRLL